jgi:hypothetical protein
MNACEALSSLIKLCLGEKGGEQAPLSLDCLLATMLRRHSGRLLGRGRLGYKS